MKRRRFLHTAGLLAAQVAFAPAVARSAGRVMTVRGWQPARRLGLTLPHEHVLVDFVGAARVSPDRYERRVVFDKTLPFLQKARQLGCRTFVDCTPNYLGRDAVLLRQLSEATGLHILTNTGYYGARNDECLPAHAITETADALAARWVAEWNDGLDGTGIRPGFMKIGVDEGHLSEVDRKLVVAAARAHRQTGLTIAVHTGPAAGAFDQLDTLAAEKIHPSAWIWVHAQSEPDSSRHVEAARRGAWVEFDGLGWGQTEQHVAQTVGMKEAGLLHRTLVSHDAGWYHVGEPFGGHFQGFEALFTHFVPALRRAGFTAQDLHQLLVTNPAEAFAVRLRLA